MNSLLKEAMEISEAVTNSVTASITWSGSARYVNNFGSSTKGEANTYLALCGASTLILATEIRPTVSDILDRLTTPPVLTTMTKAQLERRREQGKTDDEIQAERKYVFDKKKAKFDLQMRIISKNEKEITDTLQAAYEVPFGKPKMLSIADDIITDKIRIKLAERDATLSDNIDNNYMKSASIIEQDKIWAFQAKHFSGI